MVRINVNKSMLCLLVMTCVISGAMSKFIFFLIIGIFLYRNRKFALHNEQYKWFVLVALLYIGLLCMALFFFDSVKEWRPVGITVALCGISLCVLFSDRLYRNDIEDVCVIFLIFFNLMFCVFGEPSESRIGKLIEYPGQNTLGALNMIAMPHMLHTFKDKMYGLRILYFFSFLLFFCLNLGSTTIFSTAIILFWIIYKFIFKKIYIIRIKTKHRFYDLLPILIVVLIASLCINADVRELYFELLLETDIDRYTILIQAVYRILTSSQHDLLWGTWDNNFYMLSGRLVPPHNFIFEVITFSGLMGLLTLLLETYIFLSFMFKRMKCSSNKEAVLLSLMIGYLFFLLHPMYTTSFIVKMFLVLINLRACYVKRENLKA